MNETFGLVMALAAGSVLGAVFFGGLWWTIRRGVVSDRPASWFLGSFLLRTAIVLMGFYLIAQSHQWQPLAACLVGFVIARLMVTWLTRPLGQVASRPESERRHAP